MARYPLFQSIMGAGWPISDYAARDARTAGMTFWP